VAGDLPGEVSSFKDWAADSCPIFRPSGGGPELGGGNPAPVCAS
jgi:hypothetical protein